MTESLEVLRVCTWQLKTWFSPSYLQCRTRISDTPGVIPSACWLS